MADTDTLSNTGTLSHSSKQTPLPPDSADCNSLPSASTTHSDHVLVLAIADPPLSVYLTPPSPTKSSTPSALPAPSSSSNKKNPHPPRKQSMSSTVRSGFSEFRSKMASSAPSQPIPDYPSPLTINNEEPIPTVDNYESPGEKTNSFFSSFSSPAASDSIPDSTTINNEHNHTKANTNANTSTQSNTQSNTHSRTGSFFSNPFNSSSSKEKETSSSSSKTGSFFSNPFGNSSNDKENDNANQSSNKTSSFFSNPFAGSSNESKEIEKESTAKSKNSSFFGNPFSSSNAGNTDSTEKSKSKQNVDAVDTLDKSSPAESKTSASESSSKTSPFFTHPFVSNSNENKEKVNPKLNSVFSNPFSSSDSKVQKKQDTTPVASSEPKETKSSSFFAKAFSSNAKSMPTNSVDPPKIPDNELELLNADPDSLLPSERKERERLLQVYGKNWNEQKGSSNKTAHNISSSEPTLFQTLSHDSPKKITINGDKSSASKTSSFFSRFVLSKSSSSESIDGAGKNPAFVSERPSSTPPVHQPLAATPSTEIPDSTVTSTSSFSSSQSDGPLTINTRHTLPRAGVKVALTSPTTEGPKTITKPYGTGSLDGYTVLKTLGVGSFSKVRLARRTRDGTLVALKMISKKGMIAHAKFRECLENEIDLLNTLDHPNIVKLHEVIDTPTHVCLVLDYHEGGELFDYIAYHHKEITEDMAKDMVRQLVDVLDYLHRSNVCHRDLKLENILLARRTPPFKLIVTDFGLARRLVPTDPIQSAASATKSSHLPPLLTDLLTTRVGSEEYSSPEIITGKPYDGKIADFWSLGVVVYALIVGWLPFCVEERDVVVEEKVVVDVNASDVNGTLTQSHNGTHTQHNGPHTPRKESVKLIRQIQDIYRSNGSSHPSSHPSSQSSPVTPSSLPPSPFPSSATSSFASPSQTTPADPTTASATTTTTTTVRRTYSTKRAGRKALWHRISRSEFHFPDEVVTFVKGENGELKLEQSHDSTHPQTFSSTTDDASVKEKEIRGKYKLLTPDSKEVIRGLLSRKASERWGVKEIRECKWLNS